MGGLRATFGFWLATCLVGISPLFAQSADPLIELQRLQDLETRTNDLGGMQEKGGVPDPGPAQARSGACFPIQRLTVEGATAFTPEVLANIIKKYVPRCMQGADIQAVMREVDGLYANAGFITTKTYIPAQNLKSGTLILSVLEGRVEGIFLIDGQKQLEGRRANWLLWSAFPNATKGLFQLRDFEQGLDQMNRLPSVDAVLQLQPGAEPGGSFAIIQRVQTDSARAFARLDNMGSKSTGQQKLALDLEFDDLLGLNDQWTFGYSGTLNTNALSLSASVPYGYWTFGASASYSEYLTPLSTASELFGTTNALGLSARTLIARDQYSTTELSFGLNRRTSDRFINAVALTPQTLTTVDLGWKTMRISAAARNSFDATLSFGTQWFGASLDAVKPAAGAPQAQFVKFSGGWQRQGALGQLGTLVTDLRVDYSPDALYSSEQMALGSYATVRGFAESVAVGDSGFFVRNDLYLAPELWTKVLPAALRDKLAAKLQPHLFVDYGVVYDNARNTQEHAGGAGIGFSWYTDRVTIAGLVGVPLFGKGSKAEPLLQLRMDLKTW